MTDYRKNYEKKTGEKLKRKEPIHHIDLDRENNHITNLDKHPNRKSHDYAHLTQHKQRRFFFRKLLKEGIIKYEQGRYTSDLYPTKPNKEYLKRKIFREFKKVFIEVEWGLKSIPYPHEIFLRIDPNMDVEFFLECKKDFVKKYGKKIQKSIHSELYYKSCRQKTRDFPTGIILSDWTEATKKQEIRYFLKQLKDPTKIDIEKYIELLNFSVSWYVISCYNDFIHEYYRNI